MKVVTKTINNDTSTMNLNNSKYVTNNNINIQDRNIHNKHLLNENYMNVDISTNITEKRHVNNINRNASNKIRNGTLLSNISTNKYDPKYIENERKPIELYNNKPNTSINTNKKHIIQKPTLYKHETYSKKPNTQIHTNIIKNTQERSNENIPRNVQLKERLQVNNSYENNNIGQRQPTQHINYKL